MDAQELAELEAAIAAHAERLKAGGVALQVPPAQLDAVHLMQLALTGEHPPVTGALITNLRAFASLRALAKIHRHRAEARQAAESAARNARPEHQPAAKHRAKQVNLFTDSSHYERLAPTLRDVQSRSRGARKKLKAFAGALDARHGKFVRNGLAPASGAALDKLLTAWLSTRCAALEREIDFFVAEIEGPTAISPTGHRGPANNKAWHGVRGEALLTLKEAGVKAAERLALFPKARAEKKPDAVTRQRQREGEYKARKRAKTRRETKT